MSGQQDLAWETQDGVRSLQAALNSQPPVPMPLASWDTNTNSIPKLEGLDTIDLSTAPLIRSSPPVARPTILPQRSLVVTHPYSTPMGEVHQSHNPPQYVNLDGELLSQSPHSGKRVRVKSREKSGETGEVRPCRVCGERAGKHSYYGGQVCPSCRAFFRRSVQSRYNETFKCTKGTGDCEISLITRKNCQFCRYQRCIGAGMRPSWILSDEERVRRFHGRNKAVKTERAGSPTEGTSPESRSTGTNSPLLVSPSRSPNPSTSLVEEERGKILSYGEVMLRSLAGRQEQVDRTLLTDLLQVSVHGTSLSTKTAQQLSALLDRRTLAGLAALPEFQGLPAAAQAQVVEHNLPLVHRFRQAVCLSNPELTWWRLIGFLVGEEKLQSCEEDLPCDLSGKKSPGSTMMYSSLLSSASCNARPELEQAHLNLVKELAASLDLDDEVQVILTVLIITFCPDFLDLGERSAVEQAQLKFVLLLQSHLATCSPSLATARLAKTLMVPAIARQVHQLARERLII